MTLATREAINGFKRSPVLSLLSITTIAFGVPCGATSPVHWFTSKPAKPLSAIVGIAGNCGERGRVVTASARSLPALTCGKATGTLANINCTLPLIMSRIAGG